MSSCLILIKWRISFVEYFLCQAMISDGAHYKYAVSFSNYILQGKKKKRLRTWDFFYFSLFYISHSLDSRQVKKKKNKPRHDMLQSSLRLVSDWRLKAMDMNNEHEQSFSGWWGFLLGFCCCCCGVF